MAVKVDGSGHGKTSVVKSLHVCKLLDRGQSGQVEPTGTFTVLQVISVVLDCSERRSTETMEFKCHLFVLIVDDNVDV